MNGPRLPRNRNFSVRRVRADEPALLRKLRLRALDESPAAFGSTSARERAFTDAIWVERTQRGAQAHDTATFVVERGGRMVGMVVVAVEARVPSRAELFGVWVDPEVRGAGAGLALTEAAASWAQGIGMSELRLWVVATNPAALALYLRAGFVLTGAHQSMPRDPSVLEVEMVKPLD